MCIILQRNNFLQESAQRTEQLKRQQLMKSKRDSDAKHKRDTRQYIQIGKLVCKYFPSLLDVQPSAQEELSPEFAFLEFILKLHQSNPDLMRRLRDAFERQNL